MPRQDKPDYGLDAPQVVRRLLVIGGLLLLIAVLLLCVRWRALPPAIQTSVGMTLLWSGVALTGTGAGMFGGSRFGKIRFAARRIDALGLRGTEQVLDVGCGHGLMLIAAAKRLSGAKAIGIDLWQTEDQADNSTEATMRNAKIEGVADRIELKTGDARQLPFNDNSFDVVLSSWALHNIYDADGRVRAIREIARVLKPGARAMIVDIRHAQEYAAEFRSLNFEVMMSRPNFLFVIPSHCLLATKPTPK
jgi:arsenite methyltransferase